MPYIPSETTPGKDDWLCSRCGQVSNSSEPCYDCDRKEREANPVPPPPPAPDRPTRDSSRKSWPPPAPPLPPQGPYANASRKPSKTPHIKSWPPKHNSDHSFALWGFVKHKWDSLESWDRETFQFFGLIFWFIFWFFSTLLAGEGVIIFIIPWAILSLIGVIGFVLIVKRIIKGAWNKYFPEYREFQEEYKSKRKHSVEEMTTLSDLFEDYEDDDIKEKPEGSYGTYWGAQSRERKK